MSDDEAFNFHCAQTPSEDESDSDSDDGDGAVGAMSAVPVAGVKHVADKPASPPPAKKPVVSFHVPVPTPQVGDGTALAKEIRQRNVKRLQRALRQYKKHTGENIEATSFDKAREIWDFLESKGWTEGNFYTTTSLELKDDEDLEEDEEKLGHVRLVGEMECGQGEYFDGY